MINALRAHFAELGIVTRQGQTGVSTLIGLIEDDEHDLIPAFTRQALTPLVAQLRDLYRRIADVDHAIIQWHRTSELSRRVETIPDVGPVTASALSATIADASLFKCGRQMAAWLGLVPRQNSNGGKERLGRISRQGDPHVRKLLVIGAHAVLRFSRKEGKGPKKWAADLLVRNPYNVVAVALANKMARIAWAIMVSGERFRSIPA